MRQTRFVNKAKRASANQTAVAACSFPAWFSAASLIRSTPPLFIVFDAPSRFSTAFRMSDPPPPWVGLSLRSPPVDVFGSQ